MMTDGNSFWPEEVLEGLSTHIFHGQSYDYFENTPVNLYESLRQNAAHTPDKICIVDDYEKTYTYQELLRLADTFSTILFRQYHVQPGMHVALLLYNSIEYCVAFFAVMKLRAVIVPLPTKYRKDEVFSLIEKADLSGIICDSTFYEWFQDGFEFLPYFLITVNGNTGNYGLPSTLGGEIAAPEVFPNPEDDVILMFTSGTTSRSKGVMLSNYNAMHAVNVYQKVLGITANDRTIIPVPIYHVTGLIALLGLFIHTGACVHLHRFFNADRVLTDIRKHQITFLHGAPTVFSILLEHAADYKDLPSLRSCACGSSNMPPQKILKLHEWLPTMKFHTVYGLTETSSPAAIFPDDAAMSPYIGSSGHPIPGTLFKICDISGKSLPSGEVGSILIKGTVILSSYYQQETELLKDGWLDTGDLGYFNEEGYLYVTDRKKDMINRGGEKILSFDVENALYAIDGIKDAAVVGVSNSKYGEVPAAMVVLAPESTLTPKQIRKVLGTKMAAFRVPVTILITDRLPVTPNSKIDKMAIKNILTTNAQIESENQEEFK